MSLLAGLKSIWILAQAGAAQAPAAQAEQPPGAMDFLNSMLFPILAVGALFYFMMYRPEQRKRQAQQLMLSEMKKNDRVVTIGGILGTLVNVQKDSEEVTIKIDDSNNTKVRMLRSAIARVLSGEPGEKKEVENNS